ncbi:hypothetical protein ANO11243_067650 [Dothideomycetidae sp. 11243]|nr:hypothetical protein ANO11243_067650 [fungal sp. No.11243]
MWIDQVRRVYSRAGSAEASQSWVCGERGGGVGRKIEPAPGSVQYGCPKSSPMGAQQVVHHAGPLGQSMCFKPARAAASRGAVPGRCFCAAADDVRDAAEGTHSGAHPETVI